MIVTYDAALEVLRDHITYLLEVFTEEGREIVAADVLRAYDATRDELLEAATEPPTPETPSDTRRIWIDGDGTIIVAVRDQASTMRDYDHWIIYWANGKETGTTMRDHDPGDIPIADARRLVGLGGYV